MTDDEPSRDKAPPPETSAAQRVIDAFGGIGPMAAKLELPIGTVRGWKERGTIPAKHRADVLAAAKEHGIALDEADLPGEPGDDSEADVIEVTPIVVDEGKASDKPAGADSQPPSKPEAKSPAQKEPSQEAARSAIPPSSGKAPRRKPPVWPRIALAVVVAAAVVGGFATRDRWLPMLTGEETQTAGTGAMEEGPAVTPVSEDEPPAPDPEATAAVEPEPAPTAETVPAPEAGEPGDTEAAGPEAETPPTAEDLAPAAGAEVQLAQLERAVATLATRVSEVEARESASDQVARLAETTATLSQRLAALEADRAESAAATFQRLAELELALGELRQIESAVQRLTEQANVAQPSRDDVALLLGLVQLRDAVSGNRPFVAALDLLRQALGEAAGADWAPLLAPLEAHAPGGVPTVAELRRDFPEVARAVAAAGAGEDSEGMVAGVLRRISDVVTVRPIGEVEGDGAGPVVARAEVKLQAGDLAAAAAEMEKLRGPAADAAADWRAAAEARLAVERAVSALNARAISGLVQAGG